MIDKNAYIKEILVKIKTGKISPKEGQDLIRNASASNEKKEDSPFQAVVLKRPIKLSEVKPEPVAIREPGPDEVQVLVKAFGLNFSEILSVEGFYPNMPEYPFTPGCECAGIVRKVGKNVTHVKPGDEVVCTNNITFGAHASIMITGKQFVYKKPENVSFEDICGMTLVFMVNYHIFKLTKMRKQEKILIQGAAGGVGHIAVQLAKHYGATVFAACSGTEEKMAYLKSIGADYCIDYSKKDFKEEILNITNGYGVDVVVNTLTGDEIQKGIDLLAPDGRYVEIAMVGLRNKKSFDLSKLVDNQTIFSVDIGRVMKRQPELRGKYMEKMLSMLEDGTIRPHVGKVFEFDKIHEAYMYMKDRGHIGKVVVKGNLSDEFIRQEVCREKELYEKNHAKKEETGESRTIRKDIAIIGISGRFPGADNVEELWKNLENGINSIVEIPKERWSKTKYFDTDINNTRATNSKWGGFLHDIDKFDAMFFNISGFEAKYMDPQQRLLLEEAWSALESAGYANKSVDGLKVGTFIGCSPGDYQDKLIEHDVPFDAQSFWGTSPAVTSARLAYLLNLKGPGMAIDTACSSGLLGVNMACQSLWLGECQMAVAGGSFLSVTPKFYLMSGNAGMLSPTGQCHTFDQDADGFVPGEAVVALVLKPLEDAVRDRDPICGVIKGIGANQDGRTNGLTAPSSISQCQLETEVYEKFQINPETIGYVEAHGTGTKLGDPIEIDALTEAFHKFTKEKQACAIGSIKSNIGHTSAASGLAGIAKVLMSFKYGKIPPSLNYNTCNPLINMKDSPFYVADHLMDWSETKKDVKRAAVSSFGFSGTNVHVVLEEPPKPERETVPQWNYLIFPLSAKNKEALEQKALDLASWLEDSSSEISLYDIAYTLQVKREHFRKRIVFIAETKKQLIDSLHSFLNGIPDAGCIQKTNQQTSEIQEEMMKKLAQSQGQDKEQIFQVASYYVQGEDPDWCILYAKYPGRTIALPTYPFTREHYWIEEIEEEMEEEPQESMDNEEAIKLLEELQRGEMQLDDVEQLMRGCSSNEL